MKKNWGQDTLGKIELIVYDFDGVMTDNTVIVDQNGKEAVRVNRADGLGVDLFRNRGIKQIILSTESNKVVKARGKKLKLPVIQGSKDKLGSLAEYCRKNTINRKKVLYVGNDMNDYKVMRSACIAACPSDAHKEIKKISDIITKSKGGEGVIRELAGIFDLG